MSEPTPIHVLMSKVMADVGAVEKGQRNEHFQFDFRGIDDVMNAFHSALVNNGVFYIPQLISQQSAVNGKQHHVKIEMRYRFYGPAGDFIDAEVPGEAIDNGDKATSKALAAALKYMLLHTFCVPTQEMRQDDADRHAPQFETGSARPAEPQAEKAPGRASAASPSRPSLKKAASAEAGGPSSGLKRHLSLIRRAVELQIEVRGNKLSPSLVGLKANALAIKNEMPTITASISTTDDLLEILSGYDPKLAAAIVADLGLEERLAVAS